MVKNMDKMKKFCSNVAKEMYGNKELIALCMAGGKLAVPMVGFAGYTLTYLKPLTGMKIILLAIAGGVGTVMLLYGLFKFATSFQKMDQSGEHNAVYTMIAGGILLAASIVLGILKNGSASEE